MIEAFMPFDTFEGAESVEDIIAAFSITAQEGSWKEAGINAEDNRVFWEVRDRGIKLWYREAA